MGFFSQRFSVDTVPCVHTMLGLVVQRLRSIVPVVHHTEQAFDVQHKFMLPGCVKKKNSYMQTRLFPCICSILKGKSPKRPKGYPEKQANQAVVFQPQILQSWDLRVWRSCSDKFAQI